ncbi:MAG: hypothetical protein GXN98_04630 [Euryarchaeota archaeon]|nr:hypothetical protein [Euryarchaeota archaeon]
MLKVEVKHELPHLARYCISLLSLFFILLLGLSQVSHVPVSTIAGGSYLSIIMLTGSLPLIVMIVHTRMRSKADELR